MHIKKTEFGLYACDVDGETYEWEKWGAEEALDGLGQLFSLMGEPLGELVAYASNHKNGLAAALSAVDSDTVGTIMGHLTKTLTTRRGEVIEFLKRITSGKKVFCAGKPVDFNQHYEDRLGHMFKVARTAIEVQYGAFFGEIGLRKKPTAKPPATSG